MCVIVGNIFEKAFEKYHWKRNKYCVCKFTKHFLTNKGLIGSNDIALMKNNFATTDERKLASAFDKHDVNIVVISSRKPPKHTLKMSRSKQEAFCDIFSAYKKLSK